MPRFSERFIQRFQGVQFLAHYVENNTNMFVYATGSAFGTEYLISNGLLNSEQITYFNEYAENIETDLDIAGLYKANEREATSNQLYLMFTSLPAILKIGEAFPDACKITQRSPEILVSFHSIDFSYYAENGNMIKYDLTVADTTLNDNSLTPTSVRFDAEKNMCFYNADHKKRYEHFIACHEIEAPGLADCYLSNHQAARRVAFIVKNSFFYAKADFFLDESAWNQMTIMQNDAVFWPHVVRLWKFLYEPRIKTTIEDALLKIKTTFENRELILNARFMRLKKMYDIEHGNYNAVQDLVNEINVNYKILGKKPLVLDIDIKEMEFYFPEEDMTIRDKIHFYFQRVPQFQLQSAIIKNKYSEYFRELEKSKLEARKVIQQQRTKADLICQQEMKADKNQEERTKKTVLNKKPAKPKAKKESREPDTEDAVDQILIKKEAIKKIISSAIGSIFIYKNYVGERVIDKKLFMKYAHDDLYEGMVEAFLKENSEKVSIWNIILKGLDAPHVENFEFILLRDIELHLLKIINVPSPERTGRALEDLSKILSALKFFSDFIDEKRYQKIYKVISCHYENGLALQQSLGTAESLLRYFDIQADMPFLLKMKAIIKDGLKLPPSEQLNFFKMKCAQALNDNKNPVSMTVLVFALISCTANFGLPALKNILTYPFKSGFFIGTNGLSDETREKLINELVKFFKENEFFDIPEKASECFQLLTAYLCGLILYLQGQQKSQLKSTLGNIHKFMLYLFKNYYEFSLLFLRYDKAVKSDYPMTWKLGLYREFDCMVREYFTYEFAKSVDFVNPIFLFEKIIRPVAISDKELNNIINSLNIYCTHITIVKNRGVAISAEVLMDELITAGLVYALHIENDIMHQKIMRLNNLVESNYIDLLRVDSGLWADTFYSNDGEMDAVCLFYTIHCAIYIYDRRDNKKYLDISGIYDGLVPLGKQGELHALQPALKWGIKVLNLSFGELTTMNTMHVIYSFCAHPIEWSKERKEKENLGRLMNLWWDKKEYDSIRKSLKKNVDNGKIIFAVIEIVHQQNDSSGAFNVDWIKKLHEPTKQFLTENIVNPIKILNDREDEEVISGKYDWVAIIESFLGPQLTVRHCSEFLIGCMQFVRIREVEKYYQEKNAENKAVLFKTIKLMAVLFNPIDKIEIDKPNTKAGEKAAVESIEDISKTAPDSSIDQEVVNPQMLRSAMLSMKNSLLMSFIEQGMNQEIASRYQALYEAKTSKKGAHA